MPYSEAAKKATMKNIAKNHDRLEILLKKGQKEYFRTIAAKKGLSLNAYIIKLLEVDICQNQNSLPEENKIN